MSYNRQIRRQRKIRDTTRAGKARRQAAESMQRRAALAELHGHAGIAAGLRVRAIGMRRGEGAAD